MSRDKKKKSSPQQPFPPLVTTPLQTTTREGTPTQQTPTPEKPEMNISLQSINFTGDECGSCGFPIYTYQLAVTCTGPCRKIFHTTCMEMTEHETEIVVKKCDNFKWFCDQCKEKVDDLIESASQHGDSSKIIMKLLDENIKLNKEIREMEKQRSERMEEKMTSPLYSDMTRQPHQQRQAEQTQQEIIAPYSERLKTVKVSASSAGATISEKEVKDSIDMQQLQVRVRAVRSDKAGNVFLHCEDQESSEKIKEKLKSVKDKYKVDNPTKIYPKLKICRVKPIDIDTCKKTDGSYAYEELAGLIQGQNKIESDHFKINYIGKDKSDDHFIIIELDHDAYRRHCRSRSKTWYVNFCRCPVYKYIDVVRCVRCLGYGHVKTHCNGRQRCAHCAGPDHEHAECPHKDKPPSCANCATLKDGTSDTRHAANDQRRCMYHREQEDKRMSKVFDSE